MKKIGFFTMMIIAIIVILMSVSCRSSTEKKTVKQGSETLRDTTGLILVGKDIITDIILKPDTAGDPWEVEKVKGFSGDKMFRTLFDHIYSGNVTVYDCREERILKPGEIRNMQEEFGSDLSRIGKVQFTEDWYFDMNRNTMIKKIKSVSFGYSIEAAGIMSARYKALFRIKS